MMKSLLNLLLLALLLCAAAVSQAPAQDIPRPTPEDSVKFDEYGNIRFNDEKARLDNYVITLQNQPGSMGVIIAYGSVEGEAQARADRAKDYMVNTRGIEAGRFSTVDGGCRSDLTVQLWIVPLGATAPAASSDDLISPCPQARRSPRRRRNGDGGGKTIPEVEPKKPKPRPKP